MSDLFDSIRRVVSRFGRPPVVPEALRATDENMAVLDHRLGDVEEKQRAIAARLRLLEIAGNRHGILHDDD